MTHHDQEVWRPVKGYEDRYEVSSMGRVRSLPNRERSTRNRIVVLRPYVGDDGYPFVTIWRNGKKRKCTIHRLVAGAFIPNPEDKPQVNHIDGNKDNNRVSNLEWVTAAENVQHAFRVGLQEGTRQVGMRNGRAKLCDDDVLRIRQQRGRCRPDDLAKEYGVSVSLIRQIWRRVVWTHI